MLTVHCSGINERQKLLFSELFFRGGHFYAAVVCLRDALKPLLHSLGVAEPAAGTTAAAGAGAIRCEGPAVPPTADNSDWDTWSEPDRSVSRARIGLERSSLEPPPADAYATDTDNRTGQLEVRAGQGGSPNRDARPDHLKIGSGQVITQYGY